MFNKSTLKQEFTLYFMEILAFTIRLILYFLFCINIDFHYFIYYFHYYYYTAILPAKTFDFITLLQMFIDLKKIVFQLRCIIIIRSEIII